MEYNELAALRLKILGFHVQVFGTTHLPPITFNPEIKELVVKVLRTKVPITQEILDKLPPTGRTYISRALNILEIKLQKLRNNYDLVKVLMDPKINADTTPRKLSPTISAVLVDIIDESISSCEPSGD